MAAPTRAARLKAQGLKPKMPAVSAPHIVDWLLEIGPAQPAGMGMAPLSWAEIDAWSRCTGVRLAPWETRLIRRLSSAYLAEGRRAEDESCPAPYRAAATPADRAAEDRALRALLSGEG